MDSGLATSVVARNDKNKKGGHMPGPEWSLHPQLAADTTPVGDLALSRLLAINAADYPWLIR